MGQIKNIKLHIVTDIKRTTTTTTITTMGFIEVRSHAWQDGCEDLVNQLRELGFHAGQIYAIDVHNNGPDEEAIISAHWIGDPVGCDDNNATWNSKFSTTTTLGRRTTIGPTNG